MRQKRPVVAVHLQASTHAHRAEELETAKSLNNLALLYWDQGKYKEAEQLYQRALAIKEQQLGTLDFSTSICYNNLALLYEDQGKYEEAEPLFQRALAIRETQLGIQHPSTLVVLTNWHFYIKVKASLS
jgi:tetratricopeptide (TPR) repeat protein